MYSHKSEKNKITSSIAFDDAESFLCIGMKRAMAGSVDDRSSSSKLFIFLYNATRT